MRDACRSLAKRKAQSPRAKDLVSKYWDHPLPGTYLRLPPSLSPFSFLSSFFLSSCSFLLSLSFFPFVCFCPCLSVLFLLPLSHWACAASQSRKKIFSVNSLGPSCLHQCDQTIRSLVRVKYFCKFRPVVWPCPCTAQRHRVVWSHD